MILVPKELFLKLYDVQAGIGLAMIALDENDRDRLDRALNEAFEDVSAVLRAVDGPEVN